MDDRQYKDRLRAYAGDALGRRLFSDTEPRDTIPDLCAEIEHLRRELKGAKERSAQDWGRITSPDPTELEIEQHVEIERLCSEIAAMKALANGYVKLADDEMIVKQLKTGEVCFGTVNVDQVARKFGYIKLQPGQVVVNESTHSLVLHMAAKWAEHVAGNDQKITFTRTSNLEARDE
jgi:hypothetical protein